MEKNQIATQTKHGQIKAVSFAIEMQSMHNEGKFVVLKKLIRTIKKEIHKYMTSISKNEYINKLDDRGNIYSNTYHKKLKSTLLM